MNSVTNFNLLPCLTFSDLWMASTSKLSAYAATASAKDLLWYYDRWFGLFLGLFISCNC